MTGGLTGTCRGTTTDRLRVVLLALGLTLGLLSGSVPPAAPPAAANPADTASGTPADAASAIEMRGAVPGHTSAGHSLAVWTKQQTAAGTTTVRGPAVVPPTTLPVGSFVDNPVTGRREVVVPDVRRTAVLIGDSQSGASDSWPQIALRTLGYSVSFSGAGGTGFVAANGAGDANYFDSLTRGDWVLPHGDPALVVVQGGGNDAGRDASDGDILSNANALVLALKRTYPSSRLVMIGTLSRGTQDGGGRRAEVDALLGGFAEQRGIPFVSAGGWLTTYGLKAFLADAVHLNAKGNEKAARVLEQNLTALKLRAADTAVDPMTRWPPERRPLE